jgi:hypothetical protein
VGDRQSDRLLQLDHLRNAVYEKQQRLGREATAVVSVHFGHHTLTFEFAVHDDIAEARQAGTRYISSTDQTVPSNYSVRHEVKNSAGSNCSEQPGPDRLQHGRIGRGRKVLATMAQVESRMGSSALTMVSPPGIGPSRRPPNDVGPGWRWLVGLRRGMGPAIQISGAVLHRSGTQ